MDWLTFLSKIIEALAWPATALVLLFVIRKELPTIARSLRRLKYKDVELEFGETAKAVATEAKEAVPAPPDTALLPGQSKSEAQSRLETIAELAPRAAILEAWLLVEAAAADVLQKRCAQAVSSFPGPLRLRQGLQRAEVLNERQLAVFEELRRLRNEAVHVPEAQFTKPAIANYIDAALAMASYLEKVANDS